MLAHVVSNGLFWLGVVGVVGQFITVTYGNIQMRRRGLFGVEVEVEFRPMNVAATALTFLGAATARYLGY